MSRDLLEQSVVQGVEVREDDGISLELCTVLGQSGGEVIEGPFFVGSGNCTHGLYIRSGKLYAAPSFSRREILKQMCRVRMQYRRSETQLLQQRTT